MLPTTNSGNQEIPLTQFIFGQGQVLERDEKASGQHQLRKPHDATGANGGGQRPGQHSQGWRQYWSHPCGLVASAGGWKGFVSSSVRHPVDQQIQVRDIGHVTKKLFFDFAADRVVKDTA